MINRKINACGTSLPALRVLLILCALVAASCAADVREKDALKTAVAKYNYAIVRAYGEFDYTLLEASSSEAEAKKVRMVVAAYKSAGQYMKADITAIRFGDIDVDGDKARVRTAEDWSYVWFYIDTGKEAEPAKLRHYEMLYHMVRKDGRWIVDKVGEVK